MKTNTRESVIKKNRAYALAVLKDEYIVRMANKRLVDIATEEAKKLTHGNVKGQNHVPRCEGPTWFPGASVSKREAINSFGKLGYKSYWYVDAAVWAKFKDRFFKKHGYCLEREKFDFELAEDVSKRMGVAA